MDKNKTFCEMCRNEVDYVVSSCPMTETLKGVVYRYIGKEARCAKCGSLVWVHDLNDYNLKALYDVFREENGIVSLEIIRAIPEKYAIGKRPLSLLLGWGEQTFTRYFDGDVPTKQYSDILSHIYDDPSFYADLLQTNNDVAK